MVLERKTQKIFREAKKEAKGQAMFLKGSEKESLIGVPVPL